MQQQVDRTGKVRELMGKEQGGCLQQCSEFCRYWLLGDGFCDYECNNPECNYDEGECL